MAAKTLRELDPQVEVQVFAEEKYPYYPRPNLIEFVAGKLPFDKVFAFSGDWHVRQKIDIQLGNPVHRIYPGSKEVEVGGGRRVGYDSLLIASGASSFIPPIKGAAKRGVFTLRTIEDAMAMLDYLKGHGRVAVIGGGLLGLEIARAVRSRGADVEVVEVFDRLLPRQLDAQGAALLKNQVESLGIRVRLGVTTEEILGVDEVRGLRLKSGADLNADMAVIAAGVRPSLALLAEAGLATDKGLIVDDRLQTNVAGIFAAGDGIQHRGRIYGIIPASFEQARAAAFNILGQEKIYEGTVWANTLKVVGIYVTSVGLAIPEGEGYKEIRKSTPEERIYKKLVLQDDTLVGAIWMGTKKGAGEITRAATLRLKVGQWGDRLLDDAFDFSQL
jgi:nitrite reductase (NADH) large subunit